MSGQVELHGAAQATPATSRARTLLGGSIGHFIEWYDWSIYGFLAAIFAQQMFPASSTAASLIASFSVFAIGFLGRPIGALVLCPLADKYGRRSLLSITILLAGIGSFVIGLSPTYEQIGLAAPLLIVAARLLQGFSAGGEAQIAVAFLNEHAPREHRALAASPQLMVVGLAVLVATAMASLISSALPQDDLIAWGWRIPFLIGGVASLYGLFMRRGLQETPAFERSRAQHKITIAGIFSALAQHPKETFIVFALQLCGVHYYLWLVFLPTYANMIGGLDRSLGFAGNLIALIVYCAGIPIFAWLSDRHGRKPFLITSAFGFVLLTYPLLSLLSGTISFGIYLFVALVSALLIAINSAVAATIAAELFPTHVRTSGIGIPQAICAAIFGGTAPIAVTWLNGLGGVAYVSTYMIALTVAGLLVYVFVMPETRGRSLD
ncbi:MFS transporter [Microvirga solisilvae]|uniref:MFS transporter n=1 Tax=Microvirga solisilvae TaxID=2919498 RepID=UPI001FAFDD97|nr:MFS transporter [Microvirga solisilvae]